MKHMTAKRTDAADAEDFEDFRMAAVPLVFEAARTIESQLAPQLAEHGLTLAEAGVMIRLSRAPQQRLRMSDLAGLAVLSNSGLTRIIGRLVASGLVRRDSCATDRRVIYAALTEEGADRVAALMPGHLALIDRTFTGVLTAVEADAFLSALRKIRDTGRAGGAAATDHPQEGPVP
jgi:DNA-binding MarR family transcriptional regulator